LDKKTLEIRLAMMTPKINPIILPERFFKGILFNLSSMRRVRADRRRPPKSPQRPIQGEVESPLAKVYPLTPQMRNNIKRRIHEFIHLHLLSIN
jgi:hypothetical protein